MVAVFRMGVLFFAIRLAVTAADNRGSAGAKEVGPYVGAREIGIMRGNRFSKGISVWQFYLRDFSLFGGLQLVVTCGHTELQA